jgi:hypothetical protein
LKTEFDEKIESLLIELYGVDYTKLSFYEQQELHELTRRRWLYEARQAELHEEGDY